jgi:ribosomal subunit interface protein
MNFKHFKSSPGLKEYVLDRSDALQKLLDNDVTIKWSLQAEKNDISVHAHLTAGKVNFFADAQESEPRMAIEQAVDRLKIQLQKRRSRDKHAH